jgi:predicted Zn-dependent protease
MFAASAVQGTESAADLAADRALTVDDKSCAVMVVPQDAKATITNVVVDTTKQTWTSAKRGILNILGGTQQELDIEAGKKELENNYRMGLKRGVWLPMGTEVEFGRRSHGLIVDTILDRDSKLGQKLYPLADALLDDIERGIGAAHDYDFKLYIREESTLNAMALPGGFLYLDAGLLKEAAQHDKARFALAHEVGHVLQRHETRELQGLIVDSYDDSKELQKAVSSSSKGTEQAQALLKNVKISKDSYVRHTQELELQADACSVRLIFNAYPGGKELSAATKAFISSLKATQSQTPQPTSQSTTDLTAALREFVSFKERHPNFAQRIQNLHEVEGSLLASDVE